MVKEQINRLLSDEFAAAVEGNLGRDPLQIALDGRVADAAAVASQVKYLQRAQTKLPTWYSARCLLPALAFEQSSSEASAARKRYSGRVAVDLTCGLGVDAYFLARNFEHVIALERDEFLAAVARENFRRLGVPNVQIINTSTEDFLASPERFVASMPVHFADSMSANFVHSPEAFDTSSRPSDAKFAPPFDLVYADPDRRSADGRKLVLLQDCSPDIMALLPDIERVAKRLVVKLSPLFDVGEVFRVFGGTGGSNGWLRGDAGGRENGISTGRRVRAEVVSVGGECKEIVAEVDFCVEGMRCDASISAFEIIPDEVVVDPTESRGEPVAGLAIHRTGSTIGPKIGSAVAAGAQAAHRGESIDGLSVDSGEPIAVFADCVRGSDGTVSEYLNESDCVRRLHPDRTVAAVMVGLGEPDLVFEENVAEADCPKNGDPFEPDRYKWLIVPDVSLQKSRLARRYFAALNARTGGAKVWIDSDNGYGFATRRPGVIMGKSIEIQSITPFDPKSLKRELKAGKGLNIEIHRRNFPLTSAELARALGVGKHKSGSSTLSVAFTSASGGLWQIMLADRFGSVE